MQISVQLIIHWNLNIKNFPVGTGIYGNGDASRDVVRKKWPPQRCSLRLLHFPNERKWKKFPHRVEMPVKVTRDGKKRNKLSHLFIYILVYQSDPPVQWGAPPFMRAPLLDPPSTNFFIIYIDAYGYIHTESYEISVQGRTRGRRIAGFFPMGHTVAVIFIGSADFAD